MWSRQATNGFVPEPTGRRVNSAEQSCTCSRQTFHLIYDKWNDEDKERERELERQREKSRDRERERTREAERTRESQTKVEKLPRENAGFGQQD